MKVKIICKDGVVQTHYINPKNLSKLQQKHGHRLLVISSFWQDLARMRRLKEIEERQAMSIKVENYQIEEMIVAT